MPKSKRAKLITLSKTKKRGHQRKEQLISQIRECLDKYSNLYIFQTQNMRNCPLKTVRGQWKESRFFFGKNKVMMLALGKTKEDEYKENLHLLNQHITGSCGLLFTDKDKQEVIDFIKNYKEVDYARAGFISLQTISVEEGPLPQMNHALEPYLRSLGLPTLLQNGVIQIQRNFDLCKAGEVLTPERAKLLKLFDHKISEFYFSLKALWEKENYQIELFE